ncbi:hypothetical protein ACFL96_11115 [Thermoproteota archaeon]
MKTLFFDTGPIISLTTNNLLWLMEKLKESFNGEFYITDSVKEELIERPLRTKKFKFEALQVKRLMEKGVIKIHRDEKVPELAESLFQSANRIFSIRGNFLNIVHYTEVEVIAAAILSNALSIVVDERTTRKLLEDPARLEQLLKSKFHTKVKVHKDNLKRFQDATKGLKVIRSVELVTVAFEKGFLDEYITNIPHSRRTLLESVLWGVKLHGCSVSHLEIDRIVKLETRK